MNKVILMGRLTRDPDMRYSQGESSSGLARFTLAVDRRVRRDAQDGQPTADFIGCVAFGRTAEFIEKYGRKGTKFVVEGRIQTGSYERDGQRIYTTDVVVENVEFAESKNAQGGAGDGGFSGGYSSRPAQNNAAPEDGFMNIPDGIDEELPFT